MKWRCLSLPPSARPAIAWRNKTSHGLDSVREGFVAVGDALGGILDGRLYRETHPSFEAFTEAEFNIQRAHAHRLVVAAARFKTIAPVAEKKGLPARRTKPSFARWQSSTRKRPSRSGRWPPSVDEGEDAANRRAGGQGGLSLCDAH